MSDAHVTDAELNQLVGNLSDPEIGRSLGDSKMLESATVDESGRAIVRIVLPTPAYPAPERIVETVRAAVTEKHPALTGVDVQMSTEVRGKDTGGTIGLKVHNIIAVGSGKGGVGKSTIAAALAFGLKHFGARVGLMDADVYGPSIPHLVGARGEPSIVEQPGPNGQVIQRMQPVDVDGMKLMSMGFMVREDQAVIWRGPMLHKALTQFLQQTDWGELDYLIVDMPPGTGDVSLTLSQLVGLAGAVVVCTPQQVALLDAVKAISMFRQVKIPVLGIVENMTGDVFGRGGARQKAEELGIPFLGEVPGLPDVRIQGDAGRIAALVEEENPAREPLLHVCRRTAIEIARQLVESPSLPSLEIL